MAKAAKPTCVSESGQLLDSAAPDAHYLVGSGSAPCGAHYMVGEQEASMAVERVKRLKDLMDQLERLPESPERDRMLSEVRSRAVDLDTGVTPRAMLPLREPEPPAVLPRPQKRDWSTGIARTAPSRTAPSRPAPAVEPARPAVAAAPPEDLESPPWVGDLLSLEDAPLPYVEAQGDGSVPPWTLGLRA
jgi:hypothetical protein